MVGPRQVSQLAQLSDWFLVGLWRISEIIVCTRLRRRAKRAGSTLHPSSLADLFGGAEANTDVHRRYAFSIPR